jgi:hypothetical protein
MPVLQTALNLKGMIQACREMNLPNPATAADQKNLTGVKHMIEVLDSIQDMPLLTEDLLQLGYMIAAYPDAMSAALAYTGGMPHLYHAGVMRGAVCCVVSGSVKQWMAACNRACCSDALLDVRFIFNRIYRDMETKIPRSMFNAKRSDNDDGTFLLEDMR